MRLAIARLDSSSQVGWPDETPDVVERLLADRGLPLERWTVSAHGFENYLDESDYPDWYLGGRRGGNPFFLEKALEHYVSLELAGPKPDEILIDVASNAGPFIGIARRLTGSVCYEQDLQFPRRVEGDRIGGDAADMPVVDAFADVMTLHCSYDHFEGSADVGFVREAGRVLKPGGRLVIVPLYVGTSFGAKVDPRLRLPNLSLDRGMTRYLIPGLGERFSRLYDPPHLVSRVLEPAREARLDWSILRVGGFSEVVPSGYLNFALILRKRS